MDNFSVVIQHTNKVKISYILSSGCFGGSQMEDPNKLCLLNHFVFQINADNQHKKCP